jgi:single-stranded DNA-binding protein
LKSLQEKSKMTEGINNVLLQGELCWPELKYTGTGKPLFKAKIRIPTVDARSSEDRNASLRITAWDEFAEYLNSLPPKTHVRVSGRIQERSFTNKEGQRQSVTDIVVDGAETVNVNSGENQFTLQGEVVWPELKRVGERETPLFKSKVKIPFVRQDGSVGSSYIRITAWDETAEGLGSIGEGALVKVSGHIQDRTWTAPTGQKRVFTDAVVTNFTTPR